MVRPCPSEMALGADATGVCWHRARSGWHRAESVNGRLKCDTSGQRKCDTLGVATGRGRFAPFIVVEARAGRDRGRLG